MTETGNFVSPSPQNSSHYMTEADGLNGAILELTEVIAERSTEQTRMRMRLRTLDQAMKNAKKNYYRKVEDPQSPLFEKTIAGRDRAVERHLDDDEEYKELVLEHFQLREVADMDETSIGNMKSQLAALSSRIRILAAHEEVCAARLNYQSAKLRKESPGEKNISINL